MDLTDKVVVITGASSGLGAAIAIHFAKLCSKLVLVARNVTNLKRVALYCEKSNGVAPVTIVADLTEELDAERVVRETIEQCGKLDVLINNAGVISMGGIRNPSLESYDNIMSTNLRAVYHLTSLCVPHLIQTKGCIVNITCVSAVKPNINTLAYNMSKAALDSFTKCVALELAPDGVRVNAVAPGFIKTNLLKNIGLNEDQLEMYTKNIVGDMPLKKPVEGDEVAGVVAFLASDKAKGITGSIYVIDGGSMLK